MKFEEGINIMVIVVAGGMIEIVNHSVFTIAVVLLTYLFGRGYQERIMKEVIK